MELLLFGGTTEGRLLAEFFAEEGIAATLCVATDYGRALAPQCSNLRVLTGRLDREEIEGLLRSGDYRCVVDATHPYAAQVSIHLSAACQAVGLPYYRLTRPGTGEIGVRAESPTHAAALLENLPGKVLLTTGSRDLAAFAGPDLVGRCVARVLPEPGSLAHCLELGFPPAHILCMQGPFSQALNEAILEQYDIRTLVTKETGAAGGFEEKVAAAQTKGCTLLVINRPGDQEGLNLEEMKRKMKELTV